MKELLAAEKSKTITSYINFLDGGSLPVSPLELFIEISNVCNLQCSMCPTFSGLSKSRHSSIRAEDRGFFDLKESLKNMEEILKGTLNVHCFGYGEATIHPEFKEILTFLSQYDVMLDFFTNGMTLNEDLCTMLVENKVGEVSISFSGTTKEEYENVYLGGNFEQVLGGITLLSKIKKQHNSNFPIISINSLAFEHQVKNIDAFINLMADHGANIVHLKSLQIHDTIPQLKEHKAVYRYSGPEAGLIQKAKEQAIKRGIIFSAEQFENSFAYTEEDWHIAKRTTSSGNVLDNEEIIPIPQFKKVAKETIQDKTPKPVPFGEKKNTFMNIPENQLSSFTQTFHANKEESKSPCMEPFKTMYIRKNGEVKPCCFASNEALAMGDISKDNLKSVWNDKGYDFLRTSIVNGMIPKSHCQSCVKNNTGPKRHYSHYLIGKYLDWYAAKHGNRLSFQEVNVKALHDSNAEVIAKRKKLSLVQNGKKDTTFAFSAVSTPKDLKLSLLFQLTNAAINSGGSINNYLRFNLDSIQNGKLNAWVYSPKFPDIKFEVDIFLNGKFADSVTANYFRRDLKENGIGDGGYGLQYALPKEMLEEESIVALCVLRNTHICIGQRTFYRQTDSSLNQ